VLHVFLVAEQAAVFWGMTIGKRSFTFRAVAFLTRLFSLFFGHFMKMLMDFIMGESCRSLFRGIPKEEEQTATDYYK